MTLHTSPCAAVPYMPVSGLRDVNEEVDFSDVGENKATEYLQLGFLGKCFVSLHLPKAGRPGEEHLRVISSLKTYLSS